MQWRQFSSKPCLYFEFSRDLLQCKSRHTVFPDVDVSVLLPKSGIVKVCAILLLLVAFKNQLK